MQLVTFQTQKDLHCSYPHLGHAHIECYPNEPAGSKVITGFFFAHSSELQTFAILKWLRYGINISIVVTFNVVFSIQTSSNFTNGVKSCTHPSTLNVQHFGMIEACSMSSHSYKIFRSEFGGFFTLFATTSEV